MEKFEENLVSLCLDAARAAGADGADITLAKGSGLSAQVRLGKTESVERAEDYQLGLRVFVGKKTANVSTGQLDETVLKELAGRAVAMARAAPDNPWARLAEPEELASDLPQLDLYDATVLSSEALTEMALAAEDSARAEAGITNSEGGSASASHSQVFIATSKGFSAGYSRSSFGFSVVALAEKNGQMERDYDYSSAVFAADLDDPAEIGRSAAQRTLAGLGAQKPPTGQFPVIFDKRVSGSIAGHLSSALNGMAIARGTSFLKNSMGEAIAAAAITLSDNPLRPRGPGSRPFDGECLPVSRREMIKEGVLQSWFLDLATAGQLGLAPTGQAGRSLSGPPAPGPSNLMIEEGAVSQEQLISELEAGFLVTELMGSSVSLTTGDYSRGAAGFWIEQGKITRPCSEATIAGNLKEMFMQLEPANDADRRRAVSAPSLRLKSMMVAGMTDGQAAAGQAGG